MSHPAQLAQLLPLTRCCCTQEAKAACLAEARPPRRCAGFAWRRRGGFGNAGSFLPLPFERVAPLRRADAAVDVYQVSCRERICASVL
jgi:hypothetical protein